MLKIRIKTLPFLFAVICLLSCTVVKHDDKSGKTEEGVTFYFESDDFDAASYVKDNWDGKIIPDIKENAVELNDVLAALTEDPAAAGEKFGTRKEESSPWNFIVKGTLAVKELNRESAAGLLVLDREDLGSGAFCSLQIGPVIKKSAVRDSLSFISFGDFANQIEYANISREINFYIRDNVVSVIGDSLPDKSRVSFYGVFTMDKSGKVIITPVILDLSAGES